MTVDAIVIGAGFAGLYGVHRVVSEGMTVLGIEAAPSVGGTWYWNRYPGARCDVESVDYSYSFDGDLQNDWTWSERFAAQPEILAYLEHVADRFNLRRHYLFDTEVVGARFDDAGGAWVVETSAGERHRGQFLFCATAVNRPDIRGLADFAGEVYYTAAWPREEDHCAGGGTPDSVECRSLGLLTRRVIIRHRCRRAHHRHLRCHFINRESGWSIATSPRKRP